MIKLILLFIVLLSALVDVSAQFRRAEPVEPPFYIYKGSEYGRLMVRNKTTPEYFYYEAKENGDLRFPRWRLSDYSSTDSSTLYTSLPSGWAKYYLPCQLEDGDILATWDVTGDPLVYRIISGDTILAQVIGNDAFIVRGLVAIVLSAYSGKTRTEIEQIDLATLFSKIGLERNLSVSRRNGFAAMIAKVKAWAN